MGGSADFVKACFALTVDLIDSSSSNNYAGKLKSNASDLDCNPFQLLVLCLYTLCLHAKTFSPDGGAFWVRDCSILQRALRALLLYFGKDSESETGGRLKLDSESDKTSSSKLKS